MATTTIERGNMYVTVSDNSGSSQTLSSWKEYREVTSKATTTRRTKPQDLFGNATSRSHSLDVFRRGYCSVESGSTITTAPVDNYIGGGNMPSGIPNDTNLINTRLRAKIKSQNLNLAQSLAEYRQVSNMFVGAARDIILAFRSIRSGRAFPEIIRILQNPGRSTERRIANRWLEYQYGLKPLLSDIYGLTDALATKVRTGYPCYVSSSKTSTGVYVESFGPTSHFRRSWTWESTTRGRARYIVRDASLKELAQCGILNPLLLAWELIPYSFVVDWLFPVGTFLSSLDALNGTSDLRVVRSVKDKYICTYGYRDGNSVRERQTYSRTAASSIPLPQLAYEPSTSLAAVLNGLALLTQIRVGR